MAGPLILGQAVYQRHWHLSEQTFRLGHLGSHQELEPQDRKGMARTKTSGAIVPAEWRDQGQPLLTYGQSSQFNTLH